MSQVTCHRKGLELFGIICEMFHIFQGNGGLIKSHLKIYTHQKKNLLYIFSSYHELTHINLIFNSNTFIKYFLLMGYFWGVFYSICEFLNVYMKTFISVVHGKFENILIKKLTVLHTVKKKDM